MTKLPQVSGKDTIKVLQKIGFQVVGQRGSHIKLTRTIESSKQTVTIPNHKILIKGTLRNGILKPINLSIEDFAKLLKN